ncbi:MAG: ATP-binding protein [Nitrospinota bacterium]|nr:ATP-binding protein [Nitrospinota bacterium]
MTEKPEYKTPEQKRNARIKYLESLAKWHLFSLELLASLGELHHSAGQDRKPGKVFQIANEHLLKILKFDAVSYYLVDEPDSEFLLNYIWPEDYRTIIQGEVDFRIEDGTFAWAVNQNRPVIIQGAIEGRDLILHVLSTKQRVRGMFVGLISDAPPHLDETLRYTLSIIMQNTANALESVALYNLFQETNSHLEKKIRERTADLEDHMIKMREEIAYRKLAEESLWVARQEAESALNAKNDLLTQFSQDLKTPINSILAYGEIIRSEIEKSGPSSLGKSFDVMESTGRHLLKLIDGMNDLIRHSNYAADISLESFPIVNVLQGVLATLYPLARKNNNKLELETSPDLGSMVSDQSKIRQILLNIAGNACKFTQNGTIRIEGFIRAFEGGKMICFKISDTGVGMRSEEIRQLFDESYPKKSGDYQTSRPATGISFSKRLCEILDGGIEISSEPGAGSIFTIQFPLEKKNIINPKNGGARIPVKTSSFLKAKSLVDAPLKGTGKPANLSSAKSGAGDSSVRKRIWVVDEEQTNGNILCHILQGQGWDAQWLKLQTPFSINSSDGYPDLIIVGLGGSEIKGLKLISELQKSQQGKSLPVLIFSAREISEKEKNILPDQVVGVLQKGNCTRKDLIEHVEGIFDDISRD